MRSMSKCQISKFQFVENDISALRDKYLKQKSNNTRKKTDE